MMPDFIVYALLAGLSLALVAGPLGSFVVWRRMSYFGETLAHAALMGIAIGILLEVNLQASILLVCLLSAGCLILLERKQVVAMDALLGIMAHAALALGVVLLSLSPRARINLEAYLFGELLTISTGDLVWVMLTCGLVILILWRCWNDFLSVTVHRELAMIEGINADRMHALLILLMALVAAVAMKIVGVLLITALLIIPPSAARQIARTPEQMALLAAVFGAGSVALGLLAAFLLDVPVGPAIVVLAAVVFLVLHSLPSRFSA